MNLTKRRTHFWLVASLEGRLVDQDKLDHAVCAAISLCGTAEDRFVRLLEYMDHLKAEEHWCDAELTILHDRVKRFLSEPDRSA